MRRGILFAVLLAIYCSTANVILRYATDVDSPNQKRTELIEHDIRQLSSLGSHLHRRAGRAKCSAPHRGPGIVERGLKGSFDNSTIQRRMNLPTFDTIDDYIVAETGEAEAVVWGQRDGNGDENEFDTNTSIFDQFKFFQENQMSQGTSHLMGCTMLVIVSRRGVWMGHFWENISFDTDHDHHFWDKYKGDQDKIFTETVIKGMRNGKGRGRNKQQDSLRLNADKFKDNHVRAYLIHPETNADESGDYREYWDKMKEEACIYLPKLREPTRWKEHAYEPTDDNNILDETPRGRLLFKYDSKHLRIGPSADGTPFTEHRVMLWSETKELHEDGWTAGTIEKS
ncbi:hypothetical protein J4E81_009715 [Alternaria sp. BMP 2799]|nr:hypothetical protein J4E81_009715 [Alternaria sp. BMP 2799]